MTKKILSGIALVAGLMSCTEDFTNWASPQSNDGKDAAQVLQMTVTPAVNTIDFAEVTSETIKLFSTSLTADQASEYTVDISGEGVEEKTSITADEAGNVQTADLKGAVSYLYGAAPEARTLTIGISTVATNVTADGNVKVKRVATPYTLTAKLDAPYIAPNYYVVGGSKSWDSSKEQKFSHSGANVYDDPVFTIVIDAAASGDTWFAIGDDEGVEAIANNDWTKLFGIVGGNNTATSGKLDYRYNLGADNTFCVPAGPKKIKVEINMLERTFKIETISIANAYYLIGGPGEWNNSKAQKFSHSDKDVFDDPVFTYVFEGTGGDMWFAFGDEEAIDAVGANDWTKLFGTKGASEDLSGSFDRRYNLDGDHSFHVDGKASMYRFSVNMAEMTYEITPINIAAQYYVVGGVQGWSDKDKICLFTPEEGKNILSYTTKWTGAWDLKVWDADNFGNWDAAWGCTVDGDNSPSGALINSGGQAISAPSAELYTFTIDMNTMTYTWTKLADQAPQEYEFISLIGEFNGWGGDFDLKQVTPHNWYGVFTQEADGQLKFRANHDWATNWGFGNDKDWNVADGFNKIGTNGGGNIWVPAGTYAVYLNDITNSMMIIAQK
jgi:hypothetical protein